MIENCGSTSLVGGGGSERFGYRIRGNTKAGEQTGSTGVKPRSTGDGEVCFLSRCVSCWKNVWETSYAISYM